MPNEVNFMNSIKCQNCSLINFSSEAECRRCGSPIGSGPGQKSQKHKGRGGFSILGFVLIAIAVGFAYYVYTSIQQNVGQINANEANRIATQPKQQGAGLSRTEYDRGRANQVGNAIKDNPSLAEHQKHAEETQKAMQAVSNSQ